MAGVRLLAALYQFQESAVSALDTFGPYIYVGFESGVVQKLRIAKDSDGGIHTLSLVSTQMGKRHKVKHLEHSDVDPILFVLSHRRLSILSSDDLSFLQEIALDVSAFTISISSHTLAALHQQQLAQQQRELQQGAPVVSVTMDGPPATGVASGAAAATGGDRSNTASAPSSARPRGASSAAAGSPSARFAPSAKATGQQLTKADAEDSDDSDRPPMRSARGTSAASDAGSPTVVPQPINATVVSVIGTSFTSAADSRLASPAHGPHGPQGQILSNMSQLTTGTDVPRDTAAVGDSFVNQTIEVAHASLEVTGTLPHPPPVDADQATEPERRTMRLTQNASSFDIVGHSLQSPTSRSVVEPVSPTSQGHGDHRGPAPVAPQHNSGPTIVASAGPSSAAAPPSRSEAADPLAVAHGRTASSAGGGPPSVAPKGGAASQAPAVHRICCCLRDDRRVVVYEYTYDRSYRPKRRTGGSVAPTGGRHGDAAFADPTAVPVASASGTTTAGAAAGTLVKLAKEFLVPERVLSAVECNGVLCIGMQREYSVISLIDGDAKSLLGLNNDEPAMTLFDCDAYLRLANVLLVSPIRTMPKLSKQALRRTIPFEHRPSCFTVRHGLVFGFSRDGCEVFNLYDDDVVQRLPVEDARLVSHRTYKDMVVCASKKSLWLVFMFDLRTRLMEMVARYRVEDAADLLLRSGESRLEAELKIASGFAHLRNGAPAEAAGMFSSLLDAREVLRYVPHLRPPCALPLSDPARAELDGQVGFNVPCAHVDADAMDAFLADAHPSVRDAMESYDLDAERAFWHHWRTHATHDPKLTTLDDAWLEHFARLPEPSALGGSSSSSFMTAGMSATAANQRMWHGATLSASAFVTTLHADLREQLAHWLDVRVLDSHASTPAERRAMEAALVFLHVSAGDSRSTFQLLTRSASLELRDVLGFLVSRRQFRAVYLLLRKKGLDDAAHQIFRDFLCLDLNLDNRSQLRIDLTAADAIERVFDPRMASFMRSVTLKEPRRRHSALASLPEESLPASPNPHSAAAISAQLSAIDPATGSTFVHFCPMSQLYVQHGLRSPRAGPSPTAAAAAHSFMSASTHSAGPGPVLPPKRLQASPTQSQPIQATALDPADFSDVPVGAVAGATPQPDTPTTNPNSPAVVDAGPSPPPNPTSATALGSPPPEAPVLATSSPAEDQFGGSPADVSVAPGSPAGQLSISPPPPPSTTVAAQGSASQQLADPSRRLPPDHELFFASEAASVTHLTSVLTQTDDPMALLRSADPEGNTALHCLLASPFLGPRPQAPLDSLLTAATYLVTRGACPDQRTAGGLAAVLVPYSRRKIAVDSAAAKPVDARRASSNKAAGGGPAGPGWLPTVDRATIIGAVAAGAAAPRLWPVPTRRD
jgi:hypothetical protein